MLEHPVTSSKSRTVPARATNERTERLRALPAGNRRPFPTRSVLNVNGTLAT
jgi:hypothetical protein